MSGMDGDGMQTLNAGMIIAGTCGGMKYQVPGTWSMHGTPHGGTGGPGGMVGGCRPAVFSMQTRHGGICKPDGMKSGCTHLCIMCMRMLSESMLFFELH